MGNLALLEQSPEATLKPKTPGKKPVVLPPCPLTPEQAFETHVAMCFECHNAHLYERGARYCPEAYRLLYGG
jgi:cytochrome c553